MTRTADLPNIAEIIGPVLQRVSGAERPLLVAIAERLAAHRYRGWADEPTLGDHRDELRACAGREEEIARRVEALHPGAEAIQREILVKTPDLEELNRTLFAGRPLADQLAIQAAGERVGAATWRAFAERAAAPARETYLECALLEEESASCLEGILRSGS